MPYSIVVNDLVVKCDTADEARALAVQNTATNTNRAGKRSHKKKGTLRPGVRESWDRARKEAARTGESPALVRKRQAADAKKVAKKPPKKKPPSKG